MKPSNSRRPPIRRRTSRGTDLWRTLVDPDQDLSARTHWPNTLQCSVLLTMGMPQVDSADTAV